MSLFPRVFSRAWVILPVCACGFLAWTDHTRIRQVEYISRLPGRAEEVDVIDPASQTGYAHGQRELIVPERDEDSFNWIAQTQQMFARGEWRVRHVDYDNAPRGRDVNAASPYRWWLGLVAWVDHAFSDRPIGLSVERAALYADPLLQMLLLIGLTVFAARWFGAFAAALLAVGLAGTFPFAAGFIPGAPDQHGLERLCALAGILALLAGMRGRQPADEPGAAASRERLWFVIAGIIGGLGVWIGVAAATPILAGIFIGALAAAWIARRSARGNPAGVPAPPPWRAWAFSGGATIFAAYVIEYFPAHLLSWRLESVHPLYGLAWIGGGELLARAAAWIRGGKPSWSVRDIAVVAVAAAAVAALPVAMKLTDSQGFLAPDLLSFRLTNQPDGEVAANFWAWMIRDGITPRIWAVVLPLALVAPAGWLMLRRKTEPAAQASLALALGPVAVAFGFACRELAWWSMLDVALLAVLVAATVGRWPAIPRSSRWAWSAILAAIVIPGVIQLLPQKGPEAGGNLTSLEAEELIERDLAHWLAKHAGADGAVVYAPPTETTTLSFYGGLGGVGTLNGDNKAGLGVTVMIAGVTTMEEAQALLEGRDVRYIVLPSWDSFFENYTHLYLAKNFSNWESIFIPKLRAWDLPPWLRPVPYQMPMIGGFEDQSVLVFEVVDPQNSAVALSRLAEYLVETGQLDKAASVSQALRRFPADVGALAARAQVESARDDSDDLALILDSLRSRLSGGGDRFLPWDRRVSLAIVLARAKQMDLAREQVRRCLAQISEKRVRSLSTGSLYNLLVLTRAFGLEIDDRRVRATALDLLPLAVRGSL
jgi:hypothetical protein